MISNGMNTARRHALVGGIAIMMMAMGALVTGCSDPTAVACIDKSTELAGMCAPGCNWELLAGSSQGCGLNGVYQPATGSVEAGGNCQASGRCSFKCTVALGLCPHGVKEITRTAYVCASESGATCTTENETQCVNGLVSVCQGGTWSTPADCPAGQICQANPAGEYTCVAGIPFEEIVAAESGASNTGSLGPNTEEGLETGTDEATAEPGPDGGTDAPARESDSPAPTPGDDQPPG